jgi:predicted HicB family RNase H-like nuclease
MTSAQELERKLEILLDEVKDIFHATSINIEALGVQMKHKSTPKELNNILDNCNANLNELKKLLEDRYTLRLNYLITEQIKEEEAKVRRERLSEY